MCKIADGVVWILLVVAGVMDWRKKELPLWFLGGMSLIISILALCCKDISLWQRVTGVCFGFVFFLISKVTKEAIGYGDSWLILLLGIHLGITGVLQVLFAASLFAAIYALFYLWVRKWNRNATLPFVPFLAVAYLGVLFG